MCFIIPYLPELLMHCKENIKYTPEIPRVIQSESRSVTLFFFHTVLFQILRIILDCFSLIGPLANKFPCYK